MPQYDNVINLSERQLGNSALKKLSTIITGMLFSLMSLAGETFPTQQDQDALKLVTAVAQGGTGNLADQVVSTAESSINSNATGITKSSLEKYFPTVELQVNLFDFYKTQSGLLILAPLWEDDKNLVFTQDSVYHLDNRTTLNVGLGYRRLEWENKLLLGVNTFYDYEFPYGNTRSSIGLEARTTVGEINFNQYWGISGWVNAANGLQERSLGGTDIEIGVPLPYMNWAKVYGRAFDWYGVDGANDLKGTDISLRAQVPLLQGLAIEAGRRTFTDATPSENFLKLSYNATDLFKTKTPEPWISDTVYKLSSMEPHKYDKIRRENLIVKQTRNSNDDSIGNIEIGGY